MSVTLQVADYVATITLNRPEAMNALDGDSLEALHAILNNVSDRDDIRVGIITGAGEKAFCAGADLKKTMPPPESFAQLHFGATDKTAPFSRMSTTKPLIAAINGFALGGGLELAMLCDIRIAAAHASFALPEVTLASIPAGGGTQRIIRLIAASDAMLMLLTGERVPAAEALRIGLVSRVVEAADLLTEAQKIASKIAANGPLAVAAAKRLAVVGKELPLSAGLELEQQTFGLIRDSEDRIEGRVAFGEKRKPVFKGR